MVWIKPSVFGFVFLLLTQLSFAKDISTTGAGTTKDEAIQSALRLAVEYAAGVYLYSTTTVENSQLVNDKIITASKSLVSNYKILSERKEEDGLIYVNISATIDTQSINSIIHKNKAISFDDTIKDYNLISNKVEQLRKAAELLDIMKRKSLRDMYVTNYLGYDVEKISLKGTTIKLKYSISRNPFFWDAYYAIINHLNENKSFFGLFSDSESTDLCLGYQCKDAVSINPDLVDYSIGVRYAQAKLSCGSFSKLSSKFALYDNNYFDHSMGPTDNHITFGTQISSGGGIMCRGCWMDMRSRQTIFEDFSAQWIEREYYGTKHYSKKIKEDGLELSFVVSISDANIIKKLNNCKIDLVHESGAEND